jgi:bla regulator protein BlaR1
MISFVFRHLLESTLFCVLLSVLACGLRTSATARYALWLTGIAKFAIPSVLLAKTGAKIAFFWPAAAWLSSLAERVSAALSKVLVLLPMNMDAAGGTAFRGVLVVWSLGLFALVAVWLDRLRRRIHAAAPPTRRELATLAYARLLLPVRTPVRLRVSKAALEPALWGVWRPTITLPKGLSQTLSAGELEAVLLHELAHARRFDNLSAIFVHCLVCVFWFHPLLWLVERRLNLERERACDELVIACGAKARVYAAGILKVCKFHLWGVAAGVSAMTGADLNHRLENILQGRSSEQLLYVPRLLVVGLALLMSFVPIAGGYCEQCVSHGPQQLPNNPAVQPQSLRSTK